MHAGWRQSCRVCPGPPSSVLPMCSLRGAATYDYWYGGDDCFTPTHLHSSPTQDSRTTSCWAHRETLKTASTHHSDGSISTIMTDWRMPENIILSQIHTWIIHNSWGCACLLRCGCLASAVRDRVHKDGARHFFVRSLSACVKDAEGWRFGPWVGKVGRMRLGSQSLWCYCWQRPESLRMGPAKGQQQLPPPNTRMTTLWATQVLLLLSHDSSCILAHIQYITPG